jgi:hypothetical protein
MNGGGVHIRFPSHFYFAERFNDCINEYCFYKGNAVNYYLLPESHFLMHNGAKKPEGMIYGKKIQHFSDVRRRCGAISVDVPGACRRRPGRRC